MMPDSARSPAVPRPPAPRVAPPGNRPGSRARPRRFADAPVAALALLLALLALPAMCSDQPPDLAQIQQESGEISGLLAAVQSVAEPLERDIERLTARLARDESDPRGPRVDADALRAARLDLDAVSARISVVVGRNAHYRSSAAHLHDRIAELAGIEANASPGDPESEPRQAALALLRAQVQTTERLVDAFDRLGQVSQRQQALLAQRLRLLQSRLVLRASDDAAISAQDPRVSMLESVIADYLRQATHVRAEISAIAGEGEADLAERRRLALQADAAVSRAFLRQCDLDLVLAGARLDRLAALREDNLMPVRILRGGAAALEDIGESLDKVASALDGLRRGLDTQRALSARPGADEAERLAIVGDMSRLVDFQQRDLAALRERLDAERLAYERVIGERAVASLLERRPLPDTGADWGRAAANAARLPRMLGDALRGLWVLAAERARTASAAQWAALAAGSLALALALWWGRRALFRRGGDGLGLAGAALARVLPGLIPAAVWAFLGLMLEAPAEILVPVLLLCLLWPAQSFVLDLARRVLSARAGGGPGASPDRRDRRFLRSLRLGLIPAVLVAALYILSRTLPVAPILGDLLDRLAMLGLLALAVPAFAARLVLLRPGPRATPGARRRAAFAARLSRVLPVFLIATGLLGLLGFANLAWAMLSYFGWALAVAVALAVALGLLADLAVRLDARLAASGGALESLWRTQFLEPGYRACQLAAVAAAGWSLFKLWGWNAQTPAVRWLQGLSQTELLRIGSAALTPGDILVAALLVGAALWIGGWTNQVSYYLAYRRVRDAGLRRALASFTQYVVIVCGVLLALKIVGFDLTTLTVFAASLGVGIGFGMQNLVNNFISGLLLLGERPLRIGDFVSIGEHQGYVTQIGIRSLTVRTEDRQEVMIPNGSVISGTFINWTRSDSTLRQTQDIGIGYEDDRERAMRVIAEILAEDPLVLKGPAPTVFLANYADWSVVIRLTYFIDIRDGMCGGRVRSGILLEIGRRFAAQGISFPFPRQDVALAVAGGDRGTLGGRGVEE